MNKKRHLKIKNLEKRIEHFNTIYRIMISNNQKYYLEKEWFDDVAMLSKQDIENELYKLYLELFEVLKKEKEKKYEIIAIVLSAITSIVTSIIVIYLLTNK